MSMTEDDIYRTSTQYRLWSFTPEALTSIRRATSALAADRVRAAIKRSQEARKAGRATGSNSASQGDREGSSQTASTEDGSQKEMHVECLTVEEEQELVGFYCAKAMELADFCNFPTNVKARDARVLSRKRSVLTEMQATAVQYLKRFYLSNSPMTYHPKQIMPSALFLATKTENHFTSLKSFASKFPKTTPEDVIAPEFLLTQGLRFTFDVRHPHRGLEGGFMELLAIAGGDGQPPPSSNKSSKELQLEMLRVCKDDRRQMEEAASVELLKNRIREVHVKARDMLKSSALLTDAYFLYTPAQIWLSTLYHFDKKLCLFYVDVKLDSTAASKPAPPMKEKLIATLQSCSSLLFSATSVRPGEIELKELKRIDKKLYDCRNPEKLDLVGINKAQKREGEGAVEGILDDKVVKKRKLEREVSLKEAEAVFGPEL